MSRPAVRDALSVSRPRQIWLLTVAHAVNEFYSVALPPILPFLVVGFDITYAQAGGLVTVYYLVYSAFQLPAGVLADRVGKRPVLSGGMVVLAAGILVAGIAPDYPTLLVSQALAGVGGATYHPAGLSSIADLESGGTEGRAMGIHGLGGVAGTALAPALIGGLAAAFDWRVALTTAAVVGVVYAAVFQLSFDEPPTTPETSAPEKSGLAGAAASLLSVPRAPWVAGLLVANFVLAVELGATRTFTTAYAFVRVAESASLANGVFFAMLVGGGVSSIGAGHLADVADRTLLGAGTFVLTAGLLVVTHLLPPNALLLGLWFFVLGAAMYSTIPVMNALIAAYAERRFSGGLFGLTVTASALGNATGAFAFGVVAGEIGVVLTFPAVAAVSVLGGVAFLAIRWL